MNLKIKIPAQIQNVLMASVVLGVAVLLISSRTYKKSIQPSTFEIHIETLTEGKNLLTEAEVLSHLQKTLQYNPANLSVGETRLERFEEVILEIPYVKEADVYLDHNAKLHFNLRQKMPVIRMIQNGKAFYVSRQGSKIPLSEHYTLRVPMLHGFIPVNSENWNAELMSIIQVFNNSEEWERKIDQIYRKQNGEIVMIPVLSDMKIEFGKWEDVEEKLSKLEQFYEEVLPVKGWNKYESIDLRYKDQVIAKMKV